MLHHLMYHLKYPFNKTLSLIIKLQPVKKEDWEFILKLRNDPTVRVACHDTSTISIQKHVKYMAKIDNLPTAYQWIVTCDGKQIGHTKIIDHEFGYMLDESFRGKGIGTQIYKLIFLEAKKLGINKLHDTIKIEEKIPLRVALKVGFIQKEIIKKNGLPYAYSLEKIID